MKLMYYPTGAAVWVEDADVAAKQADGLTLEDPFRPEVRAERKKASKQRLEARRVQQQKDRAEFEAWKKERDAQKDDA